MSICAVLSVLSACIKKADVEMMYAAVNVRLNLNTTHMRKVPKCHKKAHLHV